MAFFVCHARFIHRRNNGNVEIIIDVVSNVVLYNVILVLCNNYYTFIIIL